MILFLEYPKCSTCVKAKKHLLSIGVDFIDRNIVENNPSQEELSDWINRSGVDIRKFFNTSGKLYRELGLKDKLESMTKEEKVKLLASNGMIVKRPLLITEDTVLIGFKEEEYINILCK